MPEIQKGDWVRVKGPDGWFRDYSQVAEVGKKSVNLGKDGRWPMRRVSSRVRKKDQSIEEIREVEERIYPC